MPHRLLLPPEPSPLQRLTMPHWEARGVALWLKRDDLLAPAPDDPFCGNKWRKLRHNLLHAHAQGYDTLLTFGGAYSNHIAATASAGQWLGCKTIGIIRGERVDNPTLARAQDAGMQLHFVDRATYRLLTRGDYAPLDALPLGNRARTAILPEGGTNALALPGCAELADEIWTQCAALPPTHIAVACGTGGTLAGVVQGLRGRCQALGVSVLKGDFMHAHVGELLQHHGGDGGTDWVVWDGHHHGGYAKTTPALLAYIAAFRQQHGVRLDPTYTGKLLYALDAQCQAGYFAPGSRVVAVHTGGLQAFPDGNG
jgi:1-aminocyclopropane-1-carboxylate deaminase/D-cysteine desulfhydrase-like pyridoxal-dependent ACC family enzyme